MSVGPWPRFHLVCPAIREKFRGKSPFQMAPSPHVGPLLPHWDWTECFSPTRNVWLVPSGMSPIPVRDWVEVMFPAPSSWHMAWHMTPWQFGSSTIAL